MSLVPPGLHVPRVVRFRRAPQRVYSHFMPGVGANRPVRLESVVMKSQLTGTKNQGAPRGREKPGGGGVRLLERLLQPSG